MAGSVSPQLEKAQAPVACSGSFTYQVGRDDGQKYGVQGPGSDLVLAAERLPSG